MKPPSGCPYRFADQTRVGYVGLLKAAELHGATHQAVMEFQVITDKRLPKIRAGRSIISFFYRKNMASVASAVVDQKTDTGRMRVSSPELTAASRTISRVSSLTTSTPQKVGAGSF
jgi:hypothetical protein